MDTVEWQAVHTVGPHEVHTAGNRFMTYFRAMLRVLSRDGRVYQEMAARQALFAVSMINLSILGLIYGMTSAGLSGTVLAGMQTSGEVGSFSPLAITIVGLLAVYLLHGATSLFVWVFCRGLGGNPRLTPHYLNMGAACIALWPAAPAMACLQAGLGGPSIMAAAVIAGVWGAMVQITAAKAASGLSTIKMAVAVAATIIYTGCFLYLWI